MRGDGRVARSGYSRSGRPMLKVSADVGSKPGSIARSFCKLRTISPDATSSTSASATCAPISRCRARWRLRLAVLPRPLSCSDGGGRGAAPQRNRAERERGEQLRRERECDDDASRRTSCRRGSVAGPNATSRRTAPQASSQPDAPPAIESSALSARKKRASRGCRRRARAAPRPRAAGRRSGPGTGWRCSRRRPTARRRPRPAASTAPRVTLPSVASFSVRPEKKSLV